jgi:hypothetical protein
VRQGHHQDFTHEIQRLLLEYQQILDLKPAISTRVSKRSTFTIQLQTFSLQNTDVSGEDAGGRQPAMRQSLYDNDLAQKGVLEMSTLIEKLAFTAQCTLSEQMAEQQKLLEELDSTKRSVAIHGTPSRARFQQIRE